jgi:hypothetical protein
MLLGRSPFSGARRYYILYNKIKPVRRRRRRRRRRGRRRCGGCRRGFRPPYFEIP